jgi:hypothetical protein
MTPKVRKELMMRVTLKARVKVRMFLVAKVRRKLAKVLLLLSLIPNQEAAPVNPHPCHPSQRIAHSHWCHPTMGTGHAVQVLWKGVPNHGVIKVAVMMMGLRQG